VSNFCVKKKQSLSYCADRDQNLPWPAPHLAHIVPDFIKIGSFGGVIAERVKTVFAP